MKNEMISLNEIRDDNRNLIEIEIEKMNQKLEMIEKLKKVNELFYEINYFWVNDFNNFDFIQNIRYPFELSFSDMIFDFNKWVSQSICSLNDKLNHRESETKFDE